MSSEIIVDSPKVEASHGALNLPLGQRSIPDLHLVDRPVELLIGADVSDSQATIREATRKGRVGNSSN